MVFTIGGEIFGATGGIRSSALVQRIQYRTISLLGTGTATEGIYQVNPNNTIVTLLGYDIGDVGTGDFAPSIRVELTDSITITVTANSDLYGLVRVAIIEFRDGTIKTVQQGSITIADTDSLNTMDITRVDTAKSFVIHLGATAGSGLADWDNFCSRVRLTDYNTVTADRDSVTDNLTVNFAVIEFY